MPNTAPVPTPQPLPDTQPEHLDPLQRRRRRIRSLAALAWLLMLSVITVSAFIRLSQSGVGCADWPVCYEQAAGHASAHPWLGLARATHRVTASAMLLVVLGLLVATGRRTPDLRHERRLALGVLLLTLWLAGLGALMRGASAPAVVLGNLLGGLATLALCGRLLVCGSDRTAPAPSLRRWAWWAMLLVFFQAAFGGLIDARHAASSCQHLSECADLARAAGWDWRVLSPWPAASAAGELAPQARGAWLHLLHRLGALLLVPVLATLAWKALRQGFSIPAIGVFVLLVLELTLGSLLAATGFPLPLALAHNLVAALLLTLLAGLA
ncbi:MAG: COX15/CtaA family protein [Rubrivivax sp.]|uniref:COX15/CtaA family protein n=1 Tax=Ottowia sp. TaxID=1898956 RepID=UPI0011DAB22D|nr:COX15/CtaA family protein [Ottowia sp.]MCC6813910.1 COX15/CtaA family protein [Rubrivivax sp.]TXI16197.1 MAG: cytochrome oxidase assembly protein [Ottowia sp.]